MIHFAPSIAGDRSSETDMELVFGLHVPEEDRDPARVTGADARQYEVRATRRSSCVGDPRRRQGDLHKGWPSVRGGCTLNGGWQRAACTPRAPPSRAPPSRAPPSRTHSRTGIHAWLCVMTPLSSPLSLTAVSDRAYLGHFANDGATCMTPHRVDVDAYRAQTAAAVNAEHAPFYV